MEIPWLGWFANVEFSAIAIQLTLAALATGNLASHCFPHDSGGSQKTTGVSGFPLDLPRRNGES